MHQDRNREEPGPRVGDVEGYESYDRCGFGTGPAVFTRENALPSRPGGEPHPRACGPALGSLVFAEVYEASANMSSENQNKTLTYVEPTSPLYMRHRHYYDESCAFEEVEDRLVNLIEESRSRRDSSSLDRKNALSTAEVDFTALRSLFLSF